MIAVKGYKGQKVAVLGLGRSGLATAAALQAGGAEPLLWMLATLHDAGSQLPGVGTVFACPVHDPGRGPFQIFLMILRHMCLKRTVLVGAAMEAFVGADPLIVVEHFDN